ncbi:DNA cytosine methyltransferase [Schinkia azotoformans]|uniref:DNA cytosine methyltransferase n=1 Tax=Schinkia azotoformans TaxID=1454 RepID=UPI002DBF2853|nr:DNA cytosine methyltransferase [Schinkia azotoformans]MEC1744138.1 DNA cytosine methyltransferase [Schinkia azotoformans]
MKQLDLFREIIVDNFAGGGGASTGIEMATGLSVDIAINHDPAAIAMHKANHPDTEHYCESVWDVDPVKACKGRKVGLAWFSPDCKHFSKAKGGKPVDKNIRGLAWIAVKWAVAVRPRVIMLENVEEFKTWGPLKDNYPDPDKKGYTFKSFVKSLESLGYQVEFKELRACDYGAPTIRKRFFMVARCDGRPIVWPQPTHGDPKSLEVKAGRLKPWRTASEIIDWDIGTPSIFERKKPLSENTLRRIARGIQKFVIDNPKPFIIKVNHSGEQFRGQKLDQPLQTVTAKNGWGIVTPTLLVNTTGHPGSKIDDPLMTITTGGHHALVTPFLATYYTETTENGVRGQTLQKPIATIPTANRFGLVTAFIAKHYGGGYTGAGTDLNEPLHTVTTVDHNALVSAYIIQNFSSSVGQNVEEPLWTTTAVNKANLVTAFLTKYYGSDIGQSLNEPLHTATTKDRFGLVTIQGTDFRIVDIGMRMLEPHELFAAQGFPSNYIIDRDCDGIKYSKAKQVARCGNAVPPPFAESLVRANLPEFCASSSRYAVGV